MTIPGFKTFLRPVLEIMAEIREVTNARSKLVPLVQKKMNFSDAEASEKLESGGNRLSNRVGWALTYLTKSGLVEVPKRGLAKITPSGEEFLKSHKGEITPRDLEIFPGYMEFKLSTLETKENSTASNANLADIDPEEKISIGYREIKNGLVEELQMKLLDMNPTQFEELVLHLIRALGYGGPTEALEHTGGSGDFGVDGIVHLDRLGLDKIYLQAKRYKPESKINSRQIQEFFGALKGRHATKGIFITTSSYQDSALEYAKSVSDTLVLLDGNHVAELMIEAKVGVSAKRVIVIPTIDSDYFES